MMIACEEIGETREQISWCRRGWWDKTQTSKNASLAVLLVGSLNYNSLLGLIGEDEWGNVLPFIRLLLIGRWIKMFGNERLDDAKENYDGRHKAGGQTRSRNPEIPLNFEWYQYWLKFFVPPLSHHLEASQWPPHHLCFDSRQVCSRQSLTTQCWTSKEDQSSRDPPLGLGWLTMMVVVGRSLQAAPWLFRTR